MSDDSSIIQLKSLNCSVCHIPCTQSCGLCKKVNYCTKEHQKSHWKLHKMDCFPAILKFNHEYGRHFIASRDILQGELIFKEKPIISGPSGKDGLYPICLSCYRIVKNEYTCTKCKWPVCNILCENDSIHCKNECLIFEKNNVLPFTFDEIHMYEKIIILRSILLKEKNDKDWFKIIDLQSHVKERRGTLKGCLLSNSAIHFIKDICKQEQFNNKDIDHVVGVLGTNAFSSEDSISSSQNFRSASYLFYNASLPAHNCIPNAYWIIQINSEYQLRACVNIPTGEMITQLYTQPFIGTYERRLHLKESKYFSCHCFRCSDPTELNTYFSSLTCSHIINATSCCQIGFLLPKDSCNENNPEWYCNNNECKIIISNDKIKKIIFNINNDINNSIPEGNSLDIIKLEEEMLLKYKTKILHENHYLIYQLENDIMQKISYILTLNLTTHTFNKQQCAELSQKLIHLSKKNLNIVNILCGNGFTRHRGRLLYFLQQGLQYKILNNLNLKSKEIKKGKYNSELKIQIDELIQIRKEAGIIFENEPESREEYHLLKFLREYTKEMQNILRFYGSESNKLNI